MADHTIIRRDGDSTRVSRINRRDGARARARFAAARYDLVIKGGRVLDPSRRIDRAADVGIAGGRIRTIDTTIAAADAADAIDAGGKIVTPVRGISSSSTTSTRSEQAIKSWSRPPA
jgi:hypothetical protein